ncbi:gliding motility-associated-like protein [Flavobacterium nitrogenifigens]|uniref:Gliding motility-associated-like protein n=2 Tax=Flavobacterium TaxID=237 RepID=A0A7W7N7M0_9FLAO|nr:MULTISPECIES: T9SS type B sorting domain-containing protein [Flavobacterium]MBB4801467.1 gliding motility-associated-like protein [Flavobacterium nitrogenifigens]MBB6386424.1 gliding motility-associated-like protein [Flavobacterium notoginsengisoli]
MNYVKVILLICLLLCIGSKTSAQNISVDPTVTPDVLVKNILINSSCLSIDNVSASGNPLAGQQSYGSFTGGSNFPFSTGLVLATSASKNAEGPYNQATSIGVKVFSWNGDPDLNTALGTSTSTHATVLEFDFIPSTNSISFNYFFASNEYQSFYPCSYSDGFAFLIKEVGTTDPYKNLAVLPNTTTAVSATTVHPKINSAVVEGTPKPGCEAVNENYFNGYNPASSPINYAGQTVVMNASTDVVPNKKYHLKLVVADDLTRNFPSAVFIEGGSFLSKINFGKDRTFANDNPVCFGENFVLDTKLNGADYTFKWYIKDASNNYVLLSGATTPTYAVITPGTYKVEATLNSASCTATGEISVEFTQEIKSTNTSILQCDDDTDGITFFDLTKVANIVKNNVSQITNQGYYESLANARNKVNPILNPKKYFNKYPNQVVYARIENTYGCFATPQIALNVSPYIIPDQPPFTTCDEDQTQDGLYQFNLAEQVTPQITSTLPSGLVVNFFLTADDALAETNPLANIFKNTVPFNQTIYVRAINGPDCYDIAPVELVVHTFDPPNFEDETLYLCKGEEMSLTVASGFKTYQWSNGETNNSTIINTAGDHTISVTDSNDCQKTKTFKVILSEPATITGADVKDFSGIDNSVKIVYTGVGDYEFSLDGSVFQDDPTFTQVRPGIYNAVAVDKHGCGISNSFLLYVLDYPRFFTPNGDGYNDLWTIQNIDQMPDYSVSIFDRYGKLLKQMNQNSSGWNGIFNGHELPSDDYWFTLLFVNGKIVKGHFSLKR